MEDFELKKELIKKAKELAENPEAQGVIKAATDLRRKWHHNDEEESLSDKEMKEEFDSYIDTIFSKLGFNQEQAHEKKQSLIAEAKALLTDKNDKRATARMKEIFNEWKLAGHAKKEEDDSLWEEFKEVRDQFYANKKAKYDELMEGFEKAKALKEEIINKAQEAVKIDNIKELSNIMKDLMDEWKKAGSAGRNNDDELWKQFLAYRQVFYDKRNSYNEEMKAVYEKRVEDKKSLITEAKHCLALSEFTAEEVDIMKGLRQRWKEVGFAGKENDDNLWSEFSAIVNKYFDNKKYYD